MSSDNGFLPLLRVAHAVRAGVDRLEELDAAGIGRVVRLLRGPRWRRRGRKLRTGLGVLVVGVAGSAVGTALSPEVPATVGPLAMDVRVVPSLHPGVQLLLPPAGRVDFATHIAPIAVEARISEVDLEGARRLIESPTQLVALQRDAPDALRTATLEAGALAAGYALVGGVTLSLLVYRRSWRRTAEVAGTLTGVLVATAGLAGLTFDSDRFAQPRFEGLLSQAPYVASQTSGLAERLETYRSGLADIVQGVTTLYAKSGELPVIPGAGADNVITVLHVSDIHLNPLGFDLTDRLVRQFKVDVVVDTGDITSWGTEVESATLSRIRQVGVPYVFVRGNHDSQRTQRAVAANPNAVVLDGGIAEVGGLVFAGLGDPRFTPDPTASTLPAPRASSTGPTPTPATATQAVVPGEDPEVIEGRRLAAIVRAWNVAHPDRPVDVAAFHEPAGTGPLDGVVPLVVAGHLHARSQRDYQDGTRVLIEGSTGGAGASGLREIVAGRPVPLDASLLYFARRGARAGQLLARDDVTVGGFGLASVSLTRTVVRPDDGTWLVPGEDRATPTCSPSPSPSRSLPSGGSSPSPGGPSASPSTCASD
jgi:hypothetical protein